METVGLGLAFERAAGNAGERDGARVFLDAVAADALADQVIGVHAHGDHFHFTFEDQASD